MGKDQCARSASVNSPLAFRYRLGPARTVVAHDQMPEVLQVNANLMLTASLRRHAQPAEFALKLVQTAIASRTAAAARDGHRSGHNPSPPPHWLHLAQWRFDQPSASATCPCTIAQYCAPTARSPITAARAAVWSSHTHHAAGLAVNRLMVLAPPLLDTIAADPLGWIVHRLWSDDTPAGSLLITSRSSSSCTISNRSVAIVLRRR